MHFLEKYYKGKKVFLTGHTGFKGSWMVYILELLGAEVKGYALPPNTEKDLFYSANIEKRCESVISDIRNSDEIQESIISFQPDYIFHLAAQPLVRLSYEIPLDTFDVNVMGTAHVLNAVRELDKVCNVICITTDKVYHNKEWLYPYRETDRLGGYDPYSASKAAAEIIIQSFRTSFFNPSKVNIHQKGIASARAGNVIGGGDWSKDRIIPDIVRALGKDLPINIRNPLAVRPWQHVLEPIFGYLLLGARLKDDPVTYSSSWNFGPNISDQLTVVDLAKIAIEAWGGGSYKTPKQFDAPHEANLLMLDISKSRTQLKWIPIYSAQEAIYKTIEWYKEASKSVAAADDITQRQIQDFLNLTKL